MRWTYNRKAEIVAAVEDGSLTLVDIKRENDISAEEFNEWKQRLAQYGKTALKTTKLQRYREATPLNRRPYVRRVKR